MEITIFKIQMAKIQIYLTTMLGIVKCMDHHSINIYPVTWQTKILGETIFFPILISPIDPPAHCLYLHEHIRLSIY